MSYYQSAASVGKNYWENSKGYFSKDRATMALLVQELPSVNKVFDTIVSQAFVSKNLLVNEKGEYVMWGEGTRAWSLRKLAEAAYLSVNTVQYALSRLRKLGLIRRVSNKLGTVIQALRFYQYRRHNPNVGLEVPFDKGHTSLTQELDTRVSETDHYRCDLKVNNTKISSSVDVATPISKEKEPLEEIGKPDSAVVAKLLEKFWNSRRRPSVIL